MCQISLSVFCTIDLFRCNQIIDKCLENLEEIRAINLSYCEQITDNGLEYFKGCHNIKRVHAIDLSFL